MDRWHEMRILTRVIETGSFSAAARALNLGQPAVSKAVAALEARLQTRLLVRSTRRLAATEAGQAFYDHAVRALAEADEADAAARSAQAGLIGTLRVGAPVTFARLLMVPFLGEFIDAHPGLSLECVLDDRVIDLVAESIDVAFRIGPLRDSEMTVRRLGGYPRLVVASPAYLERAGCPRAPVELMPHDAVAFGQAQTATNWTFRRGTAEVSVSVPSRLTLSAAEGVREAVLAGLGLAVAPHAMFAPELADGRVVRVLEDWVLPPVDLWALFPAGRMQSARVRVFVDWFVACLARQHVLG